MNTLGLRINKSVGGKSKNCIGYSPVNFPTSFFEYTAENNPQLQAFIVSSTTDDQLVILKNILDTNKNVINDVIVKFLVVAFFEAEAKHPIKCFISRHITKNNQLQHPFAEALALHINAHTSTPPSEYKQYVDTVSKVAMSIENFNAGVAAVKQVGDTLFGYLKDCLCCCVKTLREQKTLAPTEKNEIFDLAHLSLRLLLHIIQKANADNTSKLCLMFETIRLYIHDIMFDDDVPMDTKSVGGILYLSIHVMENGADSWIDVLNPGSTNTALTDLLTIEAGRLSLYSAIVTVVPADQLFMRTLHDSPAIVTLTTNILAIGDRCSSESAFILGVARTVLQISKLLDKAPDNSTGLILVDSLLVFAWAHLEHYMDSVRHLTGQMLGHVVKYSAQLDREGDSRALGALCGALARLAAWRRSLHVVLAQLAGALPPRRLLAACGGAARLLPALHHHHVRNTASIALETLLEKFILQCTTEELYAEWVEPIVSHVRHGAHDAHDAHVLSVLQRLLVRALTLDPAVVRYILPYIKEASEPGPQEPDLKCVLMLLRVARKSGVIDKLSGPPSEGEWKGIISYDVLEQAAIDAVDETRILSLSLVVESPKSTELFTEGDLRFVLHYLKYNINAQAPNFRQLTLSVMKKFIKRFEESYKVIKRQREPDGLCDKVDYYLRFMEQLRRQCFDSLLPGANYSRRFVALQILSWCEQITLEGYERPWERAYVEKLLLHLEDSYENNKQFALEVLLSCPVDLLKSGKYSISLEIEDIFRQACSLKPTDCVSAAYKLDLLTRRLPDYILLQDDQCTDVVDRVNFSLARSLLRALRPQLAACARSVLQAAARAPLYGTLHCLRHALRHVDARAISSDERWTSLIADIITTCFAVNDAVACVVNNSSPEGHLPMDMTIQITDHGNSGNVTLDDGRQVTAQMVLLCAWRSVKEVSLLLGELSARLSIRGEQGGQGAGGQGAGGQGAGGQGAGGQGAGGQGAGTLSAQQLSAVGSHLRALLAQTQHRGAFEQAYVGFTHLLTRLWRCRSEDLHALPKRWLDALLRDVQRPALVPTRRSAGLPFMIQALVTTELQSGSSAGALGGVVRALLRLARGGGGPAAQGGGGPAVPGGGGPAVPGGGGPAARAHALHMLRALVRCAALHEHVAPHVGDVLLCALHGFHGDTWAERNSSTLLFSALSVRVFGVRQRGTMTGRIFFLRYPQLYDFMLETLSEASRDAESQVLRPSLYPVLLLLARLYPSALEGTVSNLKLVAFIPHVLSCAKSSVLKTRQLAAKAIVPLISPEQYTSQIQSMFDLIHDVSIKRNYCHGILLQLARLLAARRGRAGGHVCPGQVCPGNVCPGQVCPGNVCPGQVCPVHVGAALWLLRQAAGTNPCYPIADEFTKVINLLVWSIPSLPQETIVEICSCLHTLLFESEPPAVSPGRDLCLSNAMYLYIILTTKYNLTEISDLVYKGLKHSSYEVVISVLNYLLILHNDLELETCKFQEHLITIVDKSTLNNIKNEKYIKLLCEVLKKDYLECQQKSLKILTLESNTQRYIIETKFQEKVSDEIVIKKLIDCIQNEHEKLTHVYLLSLLNFVTERMKDSSLCIRMLLDVIRVVFECSSSDNSEDTRRVIVGFIENNINKLLVLDMSSLSQAHRFELQATIWSTVITLLEDDEETIRQRVSDVLSPVCGGCRRVTHSACAQLVLEHLRGVAGGTAGVAGVAGGTAEVAGGTAEVARGTEEARVALLALIALLDFQSVVVVTDDLSDECRVFDQNEKYNIFLEETVWTTACADIIMNDFHITDHTLSFIDKPVYKDTFSKLCKKNIVMFKNIVAGHLLPRNDTLNPKIELFVNRLRKRNNELLIA